MERRGDERLMEDGETKRFLYVEKSGVPVQCLPSVNWLVDVVWTSHTSYLNSKNK